MPDRKLCRCRAVVLGILLPLLAGCLPGGSAGERLYRRHCANCHGVNGGGGVRYLADEGANLLDDSWRYGGDPSEIEYSLLNEDVRKHRTWDFTNQERRQLVDHILALRGEYRWGSEPARSPEPVYRAALGPPGRPGLGGSAGSNPLPFHPGAP